MNKNIRYLIEDIVNFNPIEYEDDQSDLMSNQSIEDLAMTKVKTPEELRYIIEKRLNAGKTYFNDIDVSEITDFSELFKKLNPQEIDISEWNVSNGINFKQMFYNCNKFNCNLSKWRLDKAENCYQASNKKAGRMKPLTESSFA